MSQVFTHNDASHLEAVLRASIAEGQPRTHRPWRKILIIVEGIYSMEGEMCRLAEIIAVKKRYKVQGLLDCHSREWRSSEPACRCTGRSMPCRYSSMALNKCPYASGLTASGPCRRTCSWMRHTALEPWEPQAGAAQSGRASTLRTSTS